MSCIRCGFLYCICEEPRLRPDDVVDRLFIAARDHHTAEYNRREQANHGAHQRVLELCDREVNEKLIDLDIAVSRYIRYRNLGPDHD